MKDCCNPRKIAIMGGTFDPIHYGHLVTAEAVMHEYQIDQVLFIPSGQPPHKTEGQVTPADHRYLMTLLATETNPRFFSSRIEIDRKGYTYTIDTIRELKEMYPGSEIYFITGADAFSNILSWKNPELLLSSCHFVAATRPGYSRAKAAPQIEALMDRHADTLHYLEVPALSISSSEIRARVKEGRPIKYLLPETVENYIYKHGLYQA
ncbi:MAG: nicotinate-nucleotide adenylyltransferase [Firmicutes bacterium]|nr:nicotinate-nucleotide adenylyltransferase [Bacillota bacterium]